MKNSTKIIIGASAAILLTGVIIVSVKGAQHRRKVKDCKESGGEWDRKQKKCVGEDGSLVIVDQQTKSDIGKQVNVNSRLKYTNVRSSAEVDDGSLGTVGNWFGIRLTDGNFLKKVTSSPVGTIKKAVTGEDGFGWYEIKLSKSIDGKSTGYVREDAVSFT